MYLLLMVLSEKVSTIFFPFQIRPIVMNDWEEGKVMGVHTSTLALECGLEENFERIKMKFLSHLRSKRISLYNT